MNKNFQVHRGGGVCPATELPELFPQEEFNLTRTSIHHEYDFLERIGAFPQDIMPSAPMPWAGIVFMMNTLKDQIRAGGQVCASRGLPAIQLLGCAHRSRQRKTRQLRLWLCLDPQPGARSFSARTNRCKVFLSSKKGTRSLLSLSTTMCKVSLS